jgi:4-oxalocrotonate tautomerase
LPLFSFSKEKEGYEMPIIKVDGPKIGLEKKRVFVKALTEAAAEAYSEQGIGSDKITVLLNEREPENVGVGGKLIVDRRK